METGDTLVTGKPSISLAMIVKDEAATIARCLASVQEFVTEIIIVDTGSSDNTKEIVAAFTDKIYDFAWVNDFAAARNYSFQLATGDYVMWLDADDVLLPDDQENLKQFLAQLEPGVAAISMYYNLQQDDQGRVISRLRRNRIVKRCKQFQWIGAVHEYLAVYGNIVCCDAAVTHCPLEHDAFRNLAIYEQRLQQGEEFTPRDLYYFANELFEHKLYNRAVEYYERFLATKQGWVEDVLATCGKLADCYYFLHDTAKQFQSIVASFAYDTPRAEACCRLGYYHLQKEEYQQAVFWYKLATNLEKPVNSWGLLNEACWTWIPHIQLCVCYSHLQQYQQAHEHNERAAQFVPNHASVVHNREFLAQYVGKENEATQAEAGKPA